MPKLDYLIVGSGLYGATFAHQAIKAGKTCLVIDKRTNLGGNIYCENIDGINVHKYGAHIFHTSNEEVWRFVNSIVPFNDFINSPIADYHGQRFNLPFNMNTFHQMWGVNTAEEAQLIISNQREDALKSMAELGYSEPRNLEEQAILLVGRDIYEKLVKEYTEKQWGRPCSELPAFIIRRLPVRFEFNNNYFNDKYQGIPIGGYNKLILGLLKGIDCETDTDYFSNREYWNSIASKVVFTGAIDEFYDFKYGKLEYRTVRFEQETLDCSDFQHNAVINYTSHDVPYTRIIEHKHFELFGDEINKIKKTVISKEYSSEWKEGMEPYYPVNNDRNNALYQRYKNLAEGEANVIFGGRLAEYKYYDMAPIIERVLNIKDF